MTNRATAAQIGTPCGRRELDRQDVVRHRTRAMEMGDLARAIRGTIVRRDDAEYEPLRRELIWNVDTPERRPDLIVRVATVDDVVAAVAFARDRGLRVAVRGGGHSWCGAALREGGVLFDLARLDAVEIEPTGQGAILGPGAISREVARRLAVERFAFPLGHCGSVRVSGFLLSGGLGWNPGGFGPACASVEAVDVVTADARLVTASAREHGELFWGARGAGVGFCAVAVRFHVRLHPLPRAIVTSSWVYPIDAAPAVGAFLDEVAPTLPRFVETVVSLTRDSPHGPTCVLSATAFANDATAGADALALLARPAATMRCLERSESQPTSFDGLYDSVGTSFPERHRYRAEAAWCDEGSATLFASLAEHVARAPSAASHVLCAIQPPATLPDAALSIMGRLFVACYAVWSEPADDTANVAWHRETTAALASRATGYYVGETDVITDPDRAARAFSPAGRARLAVMRRRYDPAGLFHGLAGG